MNEQVTHLTVSMPIPIARLLNQDNHPGKSIKILTYWLLTVGELMSTRLNELTPPRTHPAPTVQKAIVYSGFFLQHTKFQEGSFSPDARGHAWRDPIKCHVPGFVLQLLLECFWCLGLCVSVLWWQAGQGFPDFFRWDKSLQCKKLLEFSFDVLQKLWGL